MVEKWNRDDGSVMVEQYWKTVMVEQSWWNSSGGTDMLEQ